MGSFLVVVFPPLFDQDLCLRQAVEDLAPQEPVAEPGIEAFTRSVLPWTARFDVGSLCTDRFDPILHGLGNELGAVIGANERGPVAVLCRPKCSFRPLSFRMRPGFSSPMLSAAVGGCRSH